MCFPTYQLVQEREKMSQRKNEMTFEKLNNDSHWWEYECSQNKRNTPLSLGRNFRTHPCSWPWSIHSILVTGFSPCSQSVRQGKDTKQSEENPTKVPPNTHGHTCTQRKPPRSNENRGCIGFEDWGNCIQTMAPPLYIMWTCGKLHKFSKSCLEHGDNAYCPSLLPRFYNITYLGGPLNSSDGYLLFLWNHSGQVSLIRLQAWHKDEALVQANLGSNPGLVKS